MSAYPYFSHNGEILPAEQANVPLSNIEYSYGFGVYETIRVAHGAVYFPEQHCQRLMNSAVAIGLEHRFTPEFVQNAAEDLVRRNETDSCNIKIMLIGAPSPDRADLYIYCLNPLFTDRRLYKEGAHCVTDHYERLYPHAKTLNMLPSYLAYRKARQAGAQDTLLVNDEGCITEGTRSNFYCLKGRTVISPPSADILPGVTRDNVLKVAADQGFHIAEQPVPLNSLGQYDGAFLTSTPSKIVPVRSIDDFSWPEIPGVLYELMDSFNDFLNQYLQAHRAK